jgi:hypothetical protein
VPEIVACDDCGFRAATSEARFCGRCGQVLAGSPTELTEPSEAGGEDAILVESAVAADGGPAGRVRPALWLWTGMATAVFLVLVLALATGEEESPWPGELVVGVAAEIAAGIIESREPLLLPSADVARVAVVVFHRADPMIESMYGDVYAPVDAETGLLALRLVDPQLSQPTAWCSSSGWFETPTGGSSRFNALGEWMSGPAPRGLDRYVSYRDEEGRYVIDLAATVNGPQRQERVASDAVWIHRESGVRVWERSAAEEFLPVGNPRGPHCGDD